MPTLGYWKIRGLAAPIRLLLIYAGEDFEEDLYEQGDGPEFSRDVWYKAKAQMGDKLDFPNLPYYFDGDVKITQSNAILKHVARKHNLDGADATEKAIVDMLLDTAMDFRNGTVRLCYNPDFDKLKDKYLEDLVPKLDSYEKKLGDNPWFAGKNVTVADFPFYELLEQHTRMKSDLLAKYPKLTAFMKRFEELPKVSEYLKKPEVKNMPINNKVAKFK